MPLPKKTKRQYPLPRKSKKPKINSPHIINWAITDNNQMVNGKSPNHTSDYVLHLTERMLTVKKIIHDDELKSFFDGASICFSENPFFSLGYNAIGFLYPKEIILKKYHGTVLGNESMGSESEVFTRQRVSLQDCVGIIVPPSVLKYKREQLKDLSKSTYLPIYLVEAISSEESWKGKQLTKIIL